MKLFIQISTFNNYDEKMYSTETKKNQQKTKDIMKYLLRIKNIKKYSTYGLTFFFTKSAATEHSTNYQY